MKEALRFFFRFSLGKIGESEFEIHDEHVNFRDLSLPHAVSKKKQNKKE